MPNQLNTYSRLGWHLAMWKQCLNFPSIVSFTEVNKSRKNVLTNSFWKEIKINVKTMYVNSENSNSISCKLNILRNCKLYPADISSNYLSGESPNLYKLYVNIQDFHIGWYRKLCNSHNMASETIQKIQN